LKIKALLIESDKVTIDEYAQFIKPLGIKTIHDFKSDDLRAVKNEHELQLMQKAADIVCDGINHLKK
jgi:Xaa-Pro aminopeptidase